MILSNVELHRAIDDGRLVIDPEPLPRAPTAGGPHCPYNTHSVDLTLGPEIVVPTTGQPIAYDLRASNLAQYITRNSETITITRGQPYRLERNTFVLGRTQERVSLPVLAGQPGCLAARIEGKSSRARLGLLVHFTAPTVHPGWNGTLTLEMINLGSAPILLDVGVPIAQLIVEQVDGIPISNPSQFQGQNTPAGVARK
jgi:dCTP deaminase